MNVQTRLPTFSTVDMTADGEVLIPEAVRRAAGLVAGAPVVVGVNDRGEAIIMSRIQAKRRAESPEARHERVRAALDKAASGRFSTGQTTAEAMDELRGSPAP
ncbi:hypothetical protein [Sphingomonas adhaesiva]|uniref:hypothetical protein n=1 Tax=Sphingomonas adhaesiva TaxID=28212 RepID=UPI002FF9B9BC